MAMMGFDTDRNGLIEKEEFMKVLTCSAPVKAKNTSTTQKKQADNLISNNEDYSDYNITQTVDQIEQANNGQQLEEMLADYLSQNLISVARLTKKLSEKYPISKSLIHHFLELCDAEGQFSVSVHKMVL